VSNAEQHSFLFFFYLVEGIDAEIRARARFLERPYTSPFDGQWGLKNPLNAAAGLAVQDSRGAGATTLSTASTIPRERIRWSIWAKGLSGESLARFVRHEVFASFAELGQGAAPKFMAGARLTIDSRSISAPRLRSAIGRSGSSRSGNKQTLLSGTSARSSCSSFTH
jgi:type I restriction enzyme M protein